MIHQLKTWPEYFQAIADGKKTFEVRKDDRGFQVNDFLHLQEWDPLKGEYTGREIFKMVTYLLPSRDMPGIEHGYVAMSLGDAPETTLRYIGLLKN